ncbi:hypothetical protein [Micrococcoides hystricis]|uniref:DUF222 domain-containing protein n=1 Tax=Micrococcoides hystricis TaxID=1572761 RepID=A0ABV6PEC1_9MICC
MSARASIEGLTVTFEEDFTDPDDPVAKTNDSAKKCLRKVSEGNVSLGELAMQVVDRSLTKTSAAAEPHAIILEAIYSRATIAAAADKLGHDPARSAWELADELSIHTGAGTELMQAAG